MAFFGERQRQEPERRSALIISLLGGVGVLLLPWWRNHTILRDFYDYGLVVAGAGRMSLGEQPYVDFLTPIQTMLFLLARGAEAVFGTRYLSLTYANAVFIAAGFIAMTALLRRPLGFGVAVIVAAGVVAASAGQHTIIWHNALGVAWVALVVWLTAPIRLADAPGRAGRLALVCAILWLGGMTKLTYQVTALAFAGLFVLRDGWLGGLPWRRVGVSLAAYVLCGLGAPLLTELLCTGATLDQWGQNIVLMPSARVRLLQAILTPGFYLHTPHDYYAPMYFPFVGAWGLGLLVLLGAMAAWSVRMSSARERHWMMLGVVFAGATICGGVLLATNFDIGYLAGAAWLVLGTGLVLAMPTADGRVGRGLRIVLGLAGLSLLLPAWQAAWQGTRALWGHVPLVRDELCATDDLPPRFAYFRGMRIPRPFHDSMVAMARRLEELAAEGVPVSSIYFVNAMEWMVRAVPEARQSGLPLWLHEGTTLGEPEARVINHRLGSGQGIQAVVSLEAWNVWPLQMDWYLALRYRHDRVGPLFHLYRLRGGTESDWRNPLTFATTTASTAYVRDLMVTGGPCVLSLRPAGSVLGTVRPVVLEVGAPLDRLQTELVVRRVTKAASQPESVVWRIVTRGAPDDGKILQEGRVDLVSQQVEQTVDITATPSGRRVAIELDLPPGEILEAGIRRLQTDYSSGAVAGYPGPLDDSLAVQPETKTWAGALFVPGSRLPTEFAGAGMSINPIQVESGWHLFAHTPSEVWLRADPAWNRLDGEFGLWPPAWTNPGALPGVVARVVSFRPGCLEVLFEQTLQPRSREADRAPQPFAVTRAREADWVGLIFTPLDPGRNSHGHTWWRRVRAR